MRRGQTLVTNLHACRAARFCACTLMVSAAACSGSSSSSSSSSPTTQVGATRPRATPSTVDQGNAPTPTTDHASESRTRTLVVQPARWSLPAPLDREAASTRDGQIVVLGGNRDGGTSGIVDAIDLTTGAARRIAMLAKPVHDAAGGTIGGLPAVFGGGAGAASSAVQVVGRDGSTNVVGDLPQPRADVSSVSSHGTTYLVGGYDGATMTPDVLATTDGAHMRVVARLAVPVRYPAVAVLGTRLFVIGGATSGGENAGVDTDAVQQIDLRTGTVSVLSHMPTTRSHATAVVLSRRVYVLGGHVNGAWSDEVVELDAATGTLRVVAHLPRAVSDAAAVVVRGSAYLLGGETAPSTPVADVVRLRVHLSP